ncbi:MAG: cupredoxin domain-containing protein [Actinobacteria bacterium]|nr:cupredoxin domain-containing protein [Actinomycetota bacterium]
MSTGSAMVVRMRAVVWSVLTLVVATACAGVTTTSEVPTEPTTTTLTPGSTAGATTTIGGPTAGIVISGFSFGSQQTVAVGTTVIVTNDDPFTHTWTSADGLWDSGSLGQGDSFAFRFDDAGTYSFFCKIHSTEMGGSIVVEG